MLKPYLELPRSVHILCLGTFINRAGTLLLPFLSLYLTGELGFGIQFASLAMGAIGLGSIIGALVGGQLADRIGRRPVMLLSLLGSATVLRFFGELTSPYAIIVTLVLFSSLGDMYRPAASAMIGDLVPSEKRSYAFGLMYFAINLGFPIGTVFGGMLAATWFKGLFWIDAITATVYAFIIFMFIRETLPKGHADDSPDEDALLVKKKPAALGHILRNVPFLVFCLGSLLLGLTYVQSFSNLPIFMESKGIGVGLYGKLVAINGVMIVVIQIPLTAWMKHRSRALFVCLAAVITGVGFGVTALCETAPLFAISIMIWTLGEIMIAPFGFAIVTDMAPEQYRGRYLGVYTMCFAGANMLGAPLGGFILASKGGTTLWMVTMLLCLIAAILYATIRKHLAIKPVVEKA